MSSSPSRRIASRQPHNGLINQAREEKDSDLSTCLGLVCMRDFCPCVQRQSAKENHPHWRHFLLYAVVYIIARYRFFCVRVVRSLMARMTWEFALWRVWLCAPSSWRHVCVCFVSWGRAKAKVFLSLLMRSRHLFWVECWRQNTHTLTRRALCRFAVACRFSLGAVTARKGSHDVNYTNYHLKRGKIMERRFI
jgi:hypothetical protein